MQAGGKRNSHATARDSEPGRRRSGLSSGRIVGGVGSQSFVAQTLPAGGKPAWARALAGAAYLGGAGVGDGTGRGAPVGADVRGRGRERTNAGGEGHGCARTRFGD